jgi:hypothetical protein
MPYIGGVDVECKKKAGTEEHRTRAPGLDTATSLFQWEDDGFIPGRKFPACHTNGGRLAPQAAAPFL